MVFYSIHKLNTKNFKYLCAQNRTMKIRLFLLYILISIYTPLLAQCIQPAPKYEARAVWLTTIGGIDWPHSYAQSSTSIEKQKHELITILNQLQRAGINQVLLQTRIRATTIYPSIYEPWDGCLSGNPGKSPGYDALDFAVKECHRRGMEIHAWVVTIPVGKWNGAGCRHLRKRIPDLLKKIGDEGYMNPEKAQTANYVANICEEIVRNYDVDGIHLDYIRYPETWNIKVPREQGRQHITRIVSTINRRIKAIKPYVKMSCAPIGKSDDLTRYSSYGWNAYTRVCQDAQGWLRDGLMDQLFPMMYFQGRQFYPFAIDWSENNYGRIVTPGLGIYFLSPREKDWELDVISREMNVLRQYGMGHAFFRSKFFTDNTKGIYNFTLAHNATLALVPPMTWTNSKAPLPPTQLSLTGGKTLSWQNTASTEDIYYNVYASSTYPVDITDARNLIATRLSGNALTIDNADGQYFAVTASNRYGIESQALQMPAAYKPMKVKTTGALYCNGKELTLPTSLPTWQREGIMLITNVQGNPVMTRFWNGNTPAINIQNLAEGVYLLYIVNNAGVRHRCGHFIIKRHRQTAC